MLSPDAVLQNRYRIIRQLGKGGMGAVYEAKDHRLGTTVALKECLFEDDWLRQQFEREARILAKLRHPALTRVIDHFQELDGQFLVMDFVGGADVAGLVGRNDYVADVPRLLSWADQLLDALEYLHGQTPPIIHRDIKPLNLKLWSPDKIVLLDFGLAKGAALSSGVESDASIFGYTPHYAPIEQIRGSGTDARSDLYALAATFYHLLTGSVPPDALNRAAAITDGRPDPLTLANELQPDVPDPVARVLHRSLAIGASHRFVSASEMRAALRACAPALAGSLRGPSSAPDQATTVLAANAVPPVGSQTMTLAAITTALAATPAWYSYLAAAVSSVGLAWWVGLWWGEFLSDDGFRYLAAVPALIVALTAALASGRGRRWWLVSAGFFAPMLILLPTVFAPPDENAMGNALLFQPMTQTGGFGYGGYAYWLIAQLVGFATLGTLVGARSAARPDPKHALGALAAGSLAAVGAAQLIVTLTSSYAFGMASAAILGVTIVYFLGGLCFGLATPRSPVKSAFLVALGACGLAMTFYYLQLKSSDGAPSLGPVVMGVPLVLLLLIPLASVLAAFIGTAAATMIRWISG